MMSIEMVVHLIDGAAFHSLCGRPWRQVYDESEAWKLRDTRPAGDPRLERRFDIDAEVELLDWMDSCDIPRSHGKPFLAEIRSAHKAKRLGTEAACDGLMHAVQWACIGSWEAWEGRAFLYFEELLGRKVADIDELYEGDVWHVLCEEIPAMSEAEYCESVVLDWMGRREALGETLDESRDPHIMPTMASHTQLTGDLHHLLTRLAADDSLVIVVGRGHLASHLWGHGEWRLGRILNPPSKLA